MNDTCTYYLRLRGHLDESEIFPSGPLQISVKQVEMGTTLLQTRTDQSGLIGLLRYLHGKGFVLLMMERFDKVA